MNPLIDEPLAAHWETAKIEPLPICDDATFLRRITLDLAGRIPTRGEMADFRADPDRLATIDRLLEGPDFSGHWADLWAAMLNGYANAFNSDREALRLWLVDQFEARRPYNKIVTDLITATGNSAENGAVNFLARYPDDPEVRVSRLFLGVQIDCARCHDHPFDRWTEDDYANMARFFDTVQRERIGQRNLAVSNRLITRNPPKFLTGSEPRTLMWRDELALYIEHTNAFAKNFANRIWYQMMGRGIVHSPDDFNAKNPPAVPALLDALAAFGKKSAWDIREMIREIGRSQAYQRSSLTKKKTRPEERSTFAVRAVKPITPEQWHASITGILGKPLPVSRIEFLRQSFGNQLDVDFAETWTYRETVRQLMEKLALDITIPVRDLEDAYALILNREMKETDREICAGHDLQDVAFALLNSSEFFFNH